MKKINIAILGYGFMGKVYNHAIKSLNDFYPDIPRVEITSILVSERKPKSEIEYLKNRYGFKVVTSKIQDLLEDSNIDAFYIATPNNHHFNHVKLALKYNKHVLCEKPMGLSTEETSKMLEYASNKSNLISNMVFEYRYIPAISMIKNLIDNDSLGKILQFRIMYLHGSYINERPKTWRLEKGTGGALVDLGPHVLDLAKFLLGPYNINSSKKIIKMPNREVDDMSFMLCETKDKADGYIEVSRLSTGSVDDLRIEIHGTKGAVNWSLENLNYFNFFLKDNNYEGYKSIASYNNNNDNSDFPPPKVSNGWIMAHTHCLYNFIKEISDRDFTDKRTAKFIDGHYVQSKIEKIN
ncbi:Gfo/Idh/MocA family oxidoreductase [Flavobacteriaceae bacterium]|nr:Gfo/Idh/MocA family oxidoreductase [Flavobacteriaceae bacterium]